MFVRTRFAPSPTGFVHIGNMAQVVFDYAFAKQKGGKFILRIEDTDQNRLVAGAIEAIREALEWFELLPDEGPWQGGYCGPYIQSERLNIYQEQVRKLVEDGHAYYCFCSRERLDQVHQEQEKKRQAPRYDRRCRGIPLEEAKKRIHAEESFVVRLRVPDNQTVIVDDALRGKVEFDSNKIDDQVLLKSDGFPTYHLAVVVDDHLMEISHVVRGEEWLPSAPKHVLLYQYFGWEMPKLIHLPLYREPDHSKMSKRRGDVAVSWYRSQGFLPAALINFLANTVWNHPTGEEVFSLEELIKYFRWQDLSAAAPIFDLTKLEWMNGVYIRQMDPEEFGDYLIGWLINHGGDSCPVASLAARENPERVKKVALLEQGRLRKLVDFEEATQYFFEEETHTTDPDLLALLDKRGRDRETSLMQLRAAYNSLRELPTWDILSIENSLNNLKTQRHWQPKHFFMVLRIAVSGRAVTPPLFETIEAIGRKVVLGRLGTAIDVVSAVIAISN